MHSSADDSPHDDRPEHDLDVTQAETIAPAQENTSDLTATTASSSAEGVAPGELSRGETMMVRLILGRGLATMDEVEECLARRRGSGDRTGLGELLVEARSLTPRQLVRLNAEVDAESASQQLPGYRVHKAIGKGAGGMVLKATQVNLDRVVAIKVLPRKLSIDPRAVERLYAEGRAAALLNHPNIVQAFDVGQAGDCHYFVMEFVEGRTVYEAIRADGAYAEEAALDVAIPIADALAHAHQRGLIHRDVKPRNIMITPSGVAKLADLGLARIVADTEEALSEKGRPLGTPLYIAPEQIRGDEVIGPPADIYALGATLFHMVVGRPPFEARTREAMYDKHLHEPPRAACEVAPGVSEGLSEVIEKMMAKDPGGRYPTCEELLTELRAWKALCVMRRGEKGRGAGQSGV